MKTNLTRYQSFIRQKVYFAAEFSFAQIRSFDQIQFFGPTVSHFRQEDLHSISVFTLNPAQWDFQWADPGFEWPWY